LQHRQAENNVRQAEEYCRQAEEYCRQAEEYCRQAETGMKRQSNKKSQSSLCFQAGLVHCNFKQFFLDSFGEELAFSD
jgi:hypothetical protein